MTAELTEEALKQIEDDLASLPECDCPAMEHEGCWEKVIEALRLLPILIESHRRLKSMRCALSSALGPLPPTDRELTGDDASRLFYDVMNALDEKHPCHHKKERDEAMSILSDLSREKGFVSAKKLLDLLENGPRLRMNGYYYYESDLRSLLPKGHGK